MERRDEEQESELAKLRREGEEERENHEEELAELRKELATMRREGEEERENHEEELAKLKKALDEEREKPKFTQQRPVQTKIVPIKDYHPVLEEKPLEFNPRTAPIKDWTRDKLMAFFEHSTFKISDDPAQWKPELVAIKDEMVRGMGDKPNIFLCEWRANEEGETTTLWMPGQIRWFSHEYDKMLQAFRKEQDRIDTSWDDWNKLEEKNTQEEAKEQTRNERKRKQEAEDRAEKRRTGMGSSTTPCVHVKLSTCDRTSSKLVKVQLGNAKKSTWRVRW